MSTVVVPFVAFALLVAVLLYAARKRIQRQAACFALYKVRDDLVCLVAEGKLDEESKIFQYYYKRTNDFLSAAPKVGFDDAMESLIFIRRNHNKDFEAALAKSREKIAELQKLKDMQVPEVKEAVAEFYKAAFFAMVAHSSFSRFVYLRLMHDNVVPLVERLMPALSREIRLAKFVKDESMALASIGTR